MSTSFLAAVARRTIDAANATNATSIGATSTTPVPLLPQRDDSLAAFDATPGCWHSVLFLWLADHLSPQQVLLMLGVAKAWRDAGESTRFWAKAWPSLSSRRACVDRLRQLEAIRRPLADYYTLLVQHETGNVKLRRTKFGVPPDPKKVNIRMGGVQSSDPLAHAAAYVACAERQLDEAQRQLRRLREPLTPHGTRACDILEVFEAKLREEARGHQQWEGQLSLPAGLAEFAEVAAQCGLLGPSGSCQLGDLNFSLGEEYPYHSVVSHFTPAGALYLLAGNAYDDDQDYLCVEWRPHLPPRYVTFHLWDEDDLSTIAYAFSNPSAECNGPGKLVALMAGEVAMKATTCSRYALFENFGEALEALVDEIQARRDAVLAGDHPRKISPEHEHCFTCPGYGQWAAWGVVNDD